MIKKPEGFEDVLADYAPVGFDKNGEPVAWGFKLVATLSKEKFDELMMAADKHTPDGMVGCFGKGNWAIVVKWLTMAEAVQKYGGVLEGGVKYGPMGGWVSTTFGAGASAKTFTSRYMNPKILEGRR